MQVLWLRHSLEGKSCLLRQKNVLKMANVRTAQRHLTMHESLKESSKIEKTFRVATHMCILKYFRMEPPESDFYQSEKIFSESVTTLLFFISLFFPFFEHCASKNDK